MLLNSHEVEELVREHSAGDEAALGVVLRFVAALTSTSQVYGLSPLVVCRSTGLGTHEVILAFERLASERIRLLSRFYAVIDPDEEIVELSGDVVYQLLTEGASVYVEELRRCVGPADVLVMYRAGERLLTSSGTADE